MQIMGGPNTTRKAHDFGPWAADSRFVELSVGDDIEWYGRKSRVLQDLENAKLDHEYQSIKAREKRRTVQMSAIEQSDIPWKTAGEWRCDHTCEPDGQR